MLVHFTWFAIWNDFPKLGCKYYLWHAIEGFPTELCWNSISYCTWMAPSNLFHNLLFVCSHLLKIICQAFFLLFFLLFVIAFSYITICCIRTLDIHDCCIRVTALIQVNLVLIRRIRQHKLTWILLLVLLLSIWSQ